MTIHIELAPMQGFTDHIYRSAFDKHFGGIDATYSPFMLLDKGQLRPRELRELKAGQSDPRFSPQIAPHEKDAQPLATAVKQAGFSHINLNLGCPFPMLTKRRRGAGALPYPDQVDEILETLFNIGFDFISVKTRLGLSQPDEFEALIPIFNRYPISKLIIHPRIATQKYSGIPNWDAFAQYAPGLTHPIVANGDVETVNDAVALYNRFPFIHGLMLGRGLLMDPFLALRIKCESMPEDEHQVLCRFHNEIFNVLREKLSDAHLLDKLLAFWSYFSESFPNNHKLLKKLKKCRNIDQYKAVVNAAF